jgi:hypothetical protein
LIASQAFIARRNEISNVATLFVCCKERSARNRVSTQFWIPQEAKPGQENSSTVRAEDGKIPPPGYGRGRQEVLKVLGIRVTAVLAVLVVGSEPKAGGKFGYERDQQR